MPYCGKGGVLNDAAHEEWKKNVPELVAAVVATRPPDGDRPVLLMAQDEGRVGRINPVSRCWTPQGVRPIVAPHAVRETGYGFAAVALALGRILNEHFPMVHCERMLTGSEMLKQFCPSALPR